MIIVFSAIFLVFEQDREIWSGSQEISLRILVLGYRILLDHQNDSLRLLFIGFSILFFVTGLELALHTH